MRKFENLRNPILPLDLHIPDSEAHVMSDGRLYVYGSYDENEKAFCSDKYVVVSTEDMKEWTVHDISLKADQIPWINDSTVPRKSGIDWDNPTPMIKDMMKMAEQQGMDAKDWFEIAPERIIDPLLFAPDCIEKDGKYYLYFCINDNSEGVAVSEKPEGPFKNPVKLPCHGIDPAVFVDDDGKAYYYWGQFRSHGVELNKDMTSFKENQVDNLVTEEEHYFHEGSSMRKRDGHYYYVYANIERGKPTCLGYSMGSSPLGPFEYKGIIIDNEKCDPASWNNHGSIECIDGQWYVFYHRCSRGKQQYRRLCVEKIHFLEDGTIPEVKMTSQGAGEPFKAGEMIYGYQACELSGTAYIDLNEKDGIALEENYPEILRNISDGDEAVFRYVNIEKENNTIEIIYKGNAEVRIFLDDKEYVTVKTGDEQIKENSTLVRKNVIQMQTDPGVYELKMKFLNPEMFELMAFVIK